jgi:predicted transcriptional regulator
MAEQYPTVSERLEKIAADLEASESVQPITTREFLSWFGAKRRGYWVVIGIRNALRKADLRTLPDFESNYIDANLRLVPADSDSNSAVGEIETEESEPTSESDPSVASASEFDAPAYIVSRLEAANKKLTSVAPDVTLREAITLMMMNDFSQLPVMTSEREVKGIVSWASIGARLAVGKNQNGNEERFVRDFMETHQEIRANASLFAAIDVIVQQQYVLVRGLDQKVTGIVTATDLSLQFKQLTEPFLLLGEVENHLRKLLAHRFSQEELASVCEDENRTVDGVADLTFGEYQRLLEDPTNWTKMAINLDRATFCKKLDKIREIRNDVMHFDPDGIVPDDLRGLREFAQFLRLLDIVNPANAM